MHHQREQSTVKWRYTQNTNHGHILPGQCIYALCDEKLLLLWLDNGAVNKCAPFYKRYRPHRSKKAFISPWLANSLGVCLQKQQPSVLSELQRMAQLPKPWPMLS